MRFHSYSFFYFLANFAIGATFAPSSTTFLIPTAVKRKGFSSKASSITKDWIVKSTVEDVSSLDTEESSGTAKPISYKTTVLEQNSVFQHIGALAGGTLWWYLYSSYEVLTNPPIDFFGIPDWGITACGIYITLSQIIVYFYLFKLASSKTLRGGQFWIVLCILFCVPADVMVVLFDPTGSQAATVAAFALVTMFYGLFLSHYCRVASAREEQGADAKELVLLIPETIDEHHHQLNPKGVFGELRYYRPPANLQSIDMAVAFMRSFVAFTCAVAGFPDALAGDGLKIFLFLSCILVATHTTIEMIITTVFPGVNLAEYDDFLYFEATLYFLHLASASVIGHESPFGKTIWDELLYSWLFGNATASFFEVMGELLAKVDFDKTLGFTKNSS